MCVRIRSRKESSCIDQKYIWTIAIWLVVWNIFYFPIYWESHHPNWLSYFSEGWPNHQPAIDANYSSQFGTIDISTNKPNIVFTKRWSLHRLATCRSHGPHLVEKCWCSSAKPKLAGWFISWTIPSSYLVANYPRIVSGLVHPSCFSGHCPHLSILIPFITGVIPHLRFVGSSPPSDDELGLPPMTPEASKWCSNFDKNAFTCDFPEIPMHYPLLDVYITIWKITISNG